MRIIVMGTGPFCLPTCKRLATEHEIPLVVTRPVADPNAKKQPARPVAQWALESGYELFEPASINSTKAIEHLAGYQADLFFVCDYGQILSNICLQTARLGGINLHGSILPRHRGAAPVQWTLLRGDERAGVTVIHMTPRLDAGPAIALACTELLPDETAAELEPRLAEIGLQATLDALDLLSRWDGESSLGEVQDKTLVTKARRLAKADGQLDFRLPANYLVRLVRACQPWPGTFAELHWPSEKSMRLIVRRARCVQWTEVATQELQQQTQPGSAFLVNAESDLGLDWQTPWKHTIGVSTSEGVFLIGELQPAGKREMSSEEFVRGHPLEQGTNFTSPEPPATRADLE